MMETFLDLASRRQSDRAFDPLRPVEPEKLQYILQAAMLSPSACNAQPYKLIVVDDKGYIDFTDEGRRIAEKVYNRHQILTAFLISIGVSDKQAEDDACRIEHIISEETFQAIKKTVK